MYLHKIGGFMTTTIQKWGNSLALRIPKSVAENARITRGKQVKLTLHGNRLIIVPVSEPEYTIKNLIAGIDKNNIHRSVETGRAVGKEVW
jgi:antitoxin MazE